MSYTDPIERAQQENAKKEAKRIAKAKAELDARIIAGDRSAANRARLSHRLHTGESLSIDEVIEKVRKGEM